MSRQSDTKIFLAANCWGFQTQGVIMKEQNEYNKQTKIMIDLEAQLNVIFRQFLSLYVSC